MHIHQRQFILGSHAVQPAPEWLTRYIPEVGYLSYSPELPVTSVRSADGNEWHLLGSALQTDTDKESPVRELERATARDIDAMYQSWAGRWALIGDGKLYMDACGLLGCFYGFKALTGGAK